MNPAPYRPDWVDELCRRYQAESGCPLYRVVWSEDRMEWFFGEQRPRYGKGRDRWILEKWMPVKESREEWARDFEDASGPYPENGEYEYCHAFEIRVNADEEPQFMPLRRDIVELLITAFEANKMRHSDAERRAALEKRQEDIKRERKRRYDDLWDDSAPAPGAKIPEHIQMMDSFSAKTTASLPAGLPTHGFKQIGG